MNGIKLVDKSYVTIKSPNTESIDVHIQHDHYINIILPSGDIVVINGDGTFTTFDQTDTQIKSGTLKD